MANEKFTNALNMKAQKVPPIWLMRQAGRYHKHYQKLRAEHSFMDLCKNAELASEVALGPIEDFDFDVSIMFSDLLFPLEALGMGLEYTDKGPRLGFSLNHETLQSLRAPPKALEHLSFQKEVLELTRKKLPSDKSLIGFVGGPWTLYVYAVEGGHSGNLIRAKTDLELFVLFSNCILQVLTGNILLQLEGGAEVVMIFDTAAGEVSPQFFGQFLAPMLKSLVEAFPHKIGYYGKGLTEDHYSHIKQLPLAGRGYDHRFDLPKILKSGPRGFTQGNFDQALLFASPKIFERLMANYLEAFAVQGPQCNLGWVCGLGHGVLPQTPEDNVRSFVRITRQTLG